MVSTDERRQKLEALLERVRRNRKRLADEAADAAQPEDLAAPAAAEGGPEEPAPLTLPVTGADLLAEGTIELDEGDDGIFELEGGDEVAEERTVTLAASSEATEVIELTADDEVAEEEAVEQTSEDEPAAEEAEEERATPVPAGDEQAAAPAARLDLPVPPELAARDEAEEAPELPAEALAALDVPPSLMGPRGPKDTLVMAEAPKHEPQAEPQGAPSPPVAPAGEAEAEVDEATIEEPEDDEPEIEVSYGTEEALALSEELGLTDGEDELDEGAGEDLQLHPAERPTPTSQTPGLGPGEAGPLHDVPLGPGSDPPSLAGAEDLPAPPAAFDLPARAVTFDLPAPASPRTFDLPPPRLEASPGEAPASALADLPRPPAGAFDLPAPPLATFDLPARPVAAAGGTTPSAERYSGADLRAGAAVAELLSDVAPVRARTLGELLRAALSVGRTR